MASTRWSGAQTSGPGPQRPADVDRRGHPVPAQAAALEQETYEALKASLQKVPAHVTDEAVARLREFGERLARGEIDGVEARPAEPEP